MNTNPPIPNSTPPAIPNDGGASLFPMEQEVAPSAVWSLNDPAAVWMVADGELHVFASRFENGQSVGARRHLFSVPTGGLIFGVSFPDIPTFIGLSATSTAKAIIRKGRLDAWVAALQRPEHRDQAIEAAQRWLENFSALLPMQTTPFQAMIPSGKESLTVPAGASLSVAQGCWGIRIAQGRGHFLSDKHLPLSTESDWTLLTPRTWIEAVEECRMDLAPATELLTSAHAAAIIIDFHSLALKALMRQHECQTEGEHTRLSERQEMMDRSFSQALQRQAALLDATWAARLDAAADGDLLLSACRILGARMGITFTAPPERPDTFQEVEPVRAIARASKVRVRDIRLVEGWWRREHGHLLAFHRETHQPVVLIAAGGRYRAINPQTLNESSVDAAFAQTIDPRAYIFYRPLPEGVVSGRNILAYSLRGNGRDIWTILAIGLLGGLLGLIAPLVTEIIFSFVIPNGAIHYLQEIAIGLVVVALAAMVFNLTRAMALLRIEGRSDNALQAAVWDRLLRLPTSFFRGYTAGDLASRAIGINSIRQMLSGTVINSMIGGVFSVINLILIFYYSWKLAILAVCLAAVTVLFTWLVARIQLRYQRQSTAAQGYLSGLVLQLICSVAKIRITGSESRMFTLWSDAFLRKKQHDLKAALNGAIASTFNSTFPLVCTLLTYLIFVWLLQDQLGTGQFLAFNAAFGQFMVGLLAVNSSFIALIKIRPYYERSKPIFETAPEVTSGSIDPGVLSGTIRVQQVSFRYKSGGPLVLKDVSFTTKSGEFLAIVGPSGSGKSTMMRLLLGFDVPEIGEIFYDGHDLRQVDLVALRRQIGVVLQNGRVFSGNIYQNIVGAMRFSMDEAWAAAKAVGFDEDIKAMPMGMHTHISEGGTNLSGGQRQRLMIARALVRKPRIILFDEATSALDNTTQAVITHSLQAIKATRIVIAHRLSTIISADRIIVIQNGAIVQSGVYADLANQPGPFQDLARRQII